jgi:hypothetical protein
VTTARAPLSVLAYGPEGPDTDDGTGCTSSLPMRRLALNITDHSRVQVTLLLAVCWCAGVQGPPHDAMLSEGRPSYGPLGFALSTTL